MTQNAPRRRHIRARTLPYSSLLITESAEEFESVRVAFEEEIQPRGIIEEKYMDDLANLAWEILRVRRCKRSIINTAFHSALTELVRRLSGPLETRAHAQALACAWFTDADAKKEVAELLAEFQLDESAIEAQAMSRCLSQLEQLERMETSLDARYNKILCMIATFRGGLAEQLRQRTDKLMERQQNVLQLEDASSKKSTAA